MTTEDSPPSRPRRRPTLVEAVALESALHDAAIEMFLDRGYDATTMDAVARSAGITRRTLYARYPNKQVMFSDVVREALRSLPDEHEIVFDADCLLYTSPSPRDS